MSVHVASLRASGLAACNFVHKETNSGSSSVMIESQFLKQHNAECNGIPDIGNKSVFREEIDQQHAQKECSDVMNGSRTKDNFGVGCSMVRKLFAEDAPPVTRGPDDKNNGGDVEDLPQSFASENELAGLSYINSQEPGELSQANALDFVDRFLDISVKEFDQEVECRKSTGGKSKAVSSAKGTHSLIKRANLKDEVMERGVFDWDDNLEDEGGGEFFCKKRKTFSDDGRRTQRCLTQPQKPRLVYSKGGGAAKYKHNDSQACVHEERTNLVHSDSRLVFHNLEGIDKSTKVAKMNCRRSLVNEFDEQLKTAFRDGTVAVGAKMDSADMLNVGVDTQMAAEAMESLCFEVAADDHNFGEANRSTNNILKGSPVGEKRNNVHSKQHFLRNNVRSSDSKAIVRQFKGTKRSGAKFGMEPSVSSLKQSDNMKKQLDSELIRAKAKKGKLEAKEHTDSTGNANIGKAKSIEWRKDRRALKRSHIDEVDGCYVPESSSNQILVKKQHLQEEFCTTNAIAYRTRQRVGVNKLKIVDSITHGSREEINNLRDVVASKGKCKRSVPGIDACKVLNANGKFSKLVTSQAGELENLELMQHNQSNSTGMATIVKFDAMSYPRRKRTHQKISSRGQETAGQSIVDLNGSKADGISTYMDQGLKEKTWSSMCAHAALPCLNKQSREYVLQQSADNAISSCKTVSNSDFGSVNAIPKDVVEAHASKHSEEKGSVDSTSPIERAQVNSSLEASSLNRCTPSVSKCTTPINSTMPISGASPIFMGDEYLKQSCGKNFPKLSLIREITSLIAAAGPEPTSAIKDHRKRRDMSDVRVLFSHHLDVDIIKHQKKILARLGASVASSVSDATHFITDKFVRTRNMLEAIGYGRSVVTHLWLESCGQANCLIDERNYILRDAKKEKEFGFSLPVSLARACQHPLLRGRRVLITSNTKPGKEILASLVKAVHGMAVERIGRSALKDDKILDDLLILSCEEDYVACAPFLEKGAVIYSSELLLNGIVIQKLEYERHRLFVDHVKRTPSTVWLKRNSNRYLPGTKCR